MRVDAGDFSLPLADLLDRYLKRPPTRQMVEERRLAPESAETLPVLQDLVYATSDGGLLHDVYPGLVLRQRGEALRPADLPIVEATQLDGRDVAVVDLTIDRTNVGYDRNWRGFGKRRWDRDAGRYSAFVRQSLVDDYSETGADRVLQLEGRRDGADLVRSLAGRVWDAGFESYSRFVGRKLRYKTGDETVLNMMEGGGGICSEKVQALKFLTDHYGIESDYVLAGADTPSPVPTDRLRELLTTFDFRFAKRYMRYWQHTALLYRLDSGPVLVDVTNGNVPFLFLEGAAAERVLGYEDKQPVPVRMAVHEEQFYYHRVPQDIPENLFFAMEGWLEDVDLIQVFDNELGLLISADLFVTPIVYRSERAFERLRRQYAEVCSRAGLDCTVSDGWTLDSGPGRRLLSTDAVAAGRIIDSREHLLRRYDECHGEGHDAALLLVDLRDGNGALQDS